MEMSESEKTEEEAGKVDEGDTKDQMPDDVKTEEDEATDQTETGEERTEGEKLEKEGNGEKQDEGKEDEGRGYGEKKEETGEGETTEGALPPLNNSNNGLEGTVTHKILLVGGTGVGKTCIMRRFVDGEFPIKSKATLGLDFRIRSVQLEKKVVKLQLWDTSGQERFRSMTQSYYRGATGVMLVFDVTDDNTMNSLPGWVSDISNFAPEDVNIVLLANKIDLTDNRAISQEAGEEFARKNGMIYFETSAVENINITEAFHKIAQTVSVMERKRADTISGLMQQLSNDHITQPEIEEKKSICSC